MPHDRSPAGVIVAATNGDGFFASRRVDAAGRFRFEGLAPGPWQLRRFSREATRSDWRSLFGGRPTTRPARIDAHVRPGETTHVELRWEPPVVHELAGCVRVDGEPPGAWQAKLSSAARKHMATASLGIEGCFELIADAAGRHQLELWNTGYRQVRLNVTDEVMLAAGTTPWSVGWDAGALIVAGAEPEDTLVYRWQLDTLVVEARAVADETGRVEFPSLPAGAGLLTIAGDAGSGREVEVVAGESVELAL